MIDLSEHKNIHCIGIGGIGLSAIAEILVSRGYNVSGSDMKESDTTINLAQKGIRIFIGHRSENIENVDLVIYSVAVSKDNPELISAIEKNIVTATRAEILGVLMNEYENSIAISGTHGKTTTTSMVSLVLENAKLEPTILVGGNLTEIGGNVKVGHSEYFITEACEYMDSFLQLRPKVEVILNIDSDHLDYFKDIDHIVSSFSKFTKLLPKDGKIIAFDANPFVKTIIEGIEGVITFGYSESCTYYVKNIIFNIEGMPKFNVCSDGKILETLQLKIPGEHNILNALATFACCHAIGVDADIIAKTLSDFNGTQRRFDMVGTTASGIKIVDDYAHHPTEIKATLDAAVMIPHNKLWCIFQPHTYTRTIALFDQFADSFEKTDELILAEIYAAREKNIYKISSKALAEEIKKVHPNKPVSFMEDFNEIADYISENAKNGDLVITMGAGDIYKVGEIILGK